MITLRVSTCKRRLGIDSGSSKEDAFDNVCDMNICHQGTNANEQFLCYAVMM